MPFFFHNFKFINNVARGRGVFNFDLLWRPLAAAIFAPSSQSVVGIISRMGSNF